MNGFNAKMLMWNFLLHAKCGNKATKYIGECVGSLLK